MAEKHRRVFIIGSGFSASLGLPTLSGLFDKMMRFPERKGESDKKNVWTALQFLYPHFDSRVSPPSYPPFEEFLSLVISAVDFPFFMEGICESWRKSALRLLTDFMAERAQESEGSELLDKFVKNLNLGDVIITFNWDNLIERELYKQKKPVNFHSKDDQAVAVLKLHGSINWTEIPEGLVLKYPESVINLSDRIVHTLDHTYYDLWDSLDTPPLIVPPGLSKRVIVNPFFKNIWDQAFQSIIDSDSLSIIGYSIPKDDVQARSLLTIGWFSRIKKQQEKSPLSIRAGRPKSRDNGWPLRSYSV